MPFKICSVDDFGHFASQKNLERRWFPHIYVYITFIHTVYVCILFYIYVDIQHHFVVTAPDTPETHTYIEINLEHLIFQAVLHGPWSRKNCNCVDSKSSDFFKDILYQEDSYKFLMSTHNLGFRILGFYHRMQWRAAKTAGKECWGPCHGVIPSLWGFAQNCSLQIER